MPGEANAAHFQINKINEALKNEKNQEEIAKSKSDLENHKELLKTLESKTTDKKEDIDQLPKKEVDADDKPLRI